MFSSFTILYKTTFKQLLNSIVLCVNLELRMIVKTFRVSLDNNMNEVISNAHEIRAENFQMNSQKTKTILIGRHGKPALSRKVWLSANGYKKWWQAYDEGGLEANQKIPRKLLNKVAKIDYIISSPLRRAHETALAVAGDREIIIEDIYVEAPLPPPPIPEVIKFRPKIWGFIARCTWFIGLNYDSESHEEAKMRANLAAQKLANLAEQHNSIALFAHGWFNRMMRPYLLSLGYKCVEDGGDMHWSYRIYEKSE